MSNSVYVLIDHGSEEIRTPSLEALALGQKLAGEMGASIHPLVLGSDLEPILERLCGFQVDSVLFAIHEQLAQYDPDAYCQALSQILSDGVPELLLMAHSYQNIDLAPKLAAAIDKGLVTDCIGYRREEEGLVFVRQMFRNKLNADVQVRSEHPWIVTLQAGAVSSDELVAGSSSGQECSLDLSTLKIRRVSLEAFESIKGKVDLTKAEIIVAVGRGIKKAENLKIIEELAEALGAEIAASRPVVDNEWLGRDRQVGSSGQTVAPRLYLACGISGAIQHMVGMKNSECIVAINTDRNAPIFNVATYGVVGDLFEVVPALIKKLKG